MRRKYEITKTTTLALPRGKETDRGEGKEGDGKKRRVWGLLDKKRGKEGCEDNGG